MATTEAKKSKLSITEMLPSKKVTLMPVPRAGGMIKDPNHKGYFMFDGAKCIFTVPIDGKRGTLLPILTQEEREFFEEVTGYDLNFYKQKDNFWHTFEVVIVKDEAFMKGGYELDLSNPLDNLRYRLLKVQPNVSPTWEERYESGEYRFALRDVGYVEEKRAERAELMQKAYDLFRKLNTAKAMREFLTIYWLDTAKAKRPPEDAEIEVYKGLIQEIIENNVQSFITAAEDSKAEFKLLILKAMKYGLIIKKSMSGDFETVEGRYLGKSLRDAVATLTSAEMQEEYLKLTTHINAQESTGPVVTNPKAK